MVARAVRPGGALIRDDRRDLVAEAGTEAGAEAGLPPIQAKTVAFSGMDGRGGRGP